MRGNPRGSEWGLQLRCVERNVGPVDQAHGAVHIGFVQIGNQVGTVWHPNRRALVVRFTRASVGCLRLPDLGVQVGNDVFKHGACQAGRTGARPNVLDALQDAIFGLQDGVKPMPSHLRFVESPLAAQATRSNARGVDLP